jgi:putative membrane protein
MQKNLIIGLILSAIIVVFALQNAHDVKIVLWLWEIQCSLAFIIILTLLLGAILGILFSIPTLLRKNKAIEKLKEEIENHNLHKNN